jgi:hypothetical protein
VNFAPLPRTDLESFLREDAITRFLWLGRPEGKSVTALQLAVQELAEREHAVAYVFLNAADSRPYLVVLDRLEAFRVGRAEPGSDEPFDRVVVVATRGGQYPRVDSVNVTADGRLPWDAGRLLPSEVRVGRLLPEGHDDDRRLHLELRSYLEQELSWAAWPPGDRAASLLVALPSLDYTGPAMHVLALLRQGELRRRFARVYLCTFEADTHSAHDQFEPWADGIFHLGQLGVTDERKLALARRFVQESAITDVLSADSRHGYDLIAPLREANPIVRLTVLLHRLGWDERLRRRGDGFPTLLAAHYAGLVDRVASCSEALTAHLTQRLYFPRDAVRTLYPGVDQDCFRPADADDETNVRQVLWCGRLCEDKRPLVALEVAARVQAEHPHVRFLFIGDGPDREAFAHSYHRLKSEGHAVDWLPIAHEMHLRLRESHCLLVTDCHPEIARTLLEAVSCGVPAVLAVGDGPAQEIAPYGSFHEVTDTENVEEYCRRTEEALDTVRGGGAPFLSVERWAREFVDWMFPAPEETSTVAASMREAA